MTIEERINKAAENIPGNIAVIILDDAHKRIYDWKASGGKDDDPYIEQQARYVERVAQVFKKKHGVI